MARRVVKSLHNMDFDEVSLVDRGANQYSEVLIAKRAPEEDNMPEFYNEDGELLDDSALAPGMTVFDAEGEEYELSEVDPEPEEGEREEALATVGKRDSAFLDAPAPTGSSFADAVREELSKAYSDDDRDKVISKALGRVDELSKQVAEYQTIAKSERDLRLEREYIAKADTYNLPIAPDELGPVLYRMAETMSYDDCSVINKALETAGTALFQEIGYQGGGDNVDIMDQIEAQARETIGKSAEGMSDPELIEKAFEANPALYDQYVNEHGFNRG